MYFINEITSNIRQVLNSSPNLTRTIPDPSWCLNIKPRTYPEVRQTIDSGLKKRNLVQTFAPNPCSRWVSGSISTCLKIEIETEIGKLEQLRSVLVCVVRPVFLILETSCQYSVIWRAVQSNIV